MFYVLGGDLRFDEGRTREAKRRERTAQTNHKSKTTSFGKLNREKKKKIKFRTKKIKDPIADVTGILSFPTNLIIITILN